MTKIFVLFLLGIFLLPSVFTLSSSSYQIDGGSTIFYRWVQTENKDIQTSAIAFIYDNITFQCRYPTKYEKEVISISSLTFIFQQT